MYCIPYSSNTWCAIMAHVRLGYDFFQFDTSLVFSLWIISLYLLLNYCPFIQTVSKRCLIVTCRAGEWSRCFIVTFQVALSSTPQRSAEEHSGSDMEISGRMACVPSTWPSTARTCCVSSWDVEPPWMETLTQSWITQRRYNTLWLCAVVTHLGLTEKCLLMSLVF